MVAKVIEIRDSGTFLPAIAVKLGSDVDQERWLLGSAGYGVKKEDQEGYVMLCKIAGGEPCDAHIDPFTWGQNPRTYFHAHRYLVEHFDEIEPGAVVDVQVILGETKVPKVSDRYYVYEG